MISWLIVAAAMSELKMESIGDGPDSGSYPHSLWLKPKEERQNVAGQDM